MSSNIPAGGNSEEEAQADDETKDLRVSAPLIHVCLGWNPLALRGFAG